jgi:hypothetical protein
MPAVCAASLPPFAFLSSCRSANSARELTLVFRIYQRLVSLLSFFSLRSGERLAAVGFVSCRGGAAFGLACDAERFGGAPCADGRAVAGWAARAADRSSARAGAGCAGLAAGRPGFPGRTFGAPLCVAVAGAAAGLPSTRGCVAGACAIGLGRISTRSPGRAPACVCARVCGVGVACCRGFTGGSIRAPGTAVGCGAGA